MQLQISVLWHNLRHDPWQVEDLSREIRHVTVEENEEGLDDPGVECEAGCEGTYDAINGSHQNTSQRNHKETDHTE